MYMFRRFGLQVLKMPPEVFETLLQLMSSGCSFVAHMSVKQYILYNVWLLVHRYPYIKMCKLFRPKQITFLLSFVTISFTTSNYQSKLVQLFEHKNKYLYMYRCLLYTSFLRFATTVVVCKKFTWKTTTSYSVDLNIEQRYDISCLRFVIPLSLPLFCQKNYM